MALTDWLREEHERCELPEWIMRKVRAERKGAKYYRHIDHSSPNKKVWRDGGEPAFTVMTGFGHPVRVEVPLDYPDGLYNCRDYNKSRQWRDLGQPAFTVTISDTHGRERVKLDSNSGESVVYKLDREARCILQTLPTIVDDNTCIGNAVPPLLAMAVAGANSREGEVALLCK